MRIGTMLISGLLSTGLGGYMTQGALARGYQGAETQTRYTHVQDSRRDFDDRRISDDRRDLDDRHEYVVSHDRDGSWDRDAHRDFDRHDNFRAGDRDRR